MFSSRIRSSCFVLCIGLCISDGSGRAEVIIEYSGSKDPVRSGWRLAQGSGAAGRTNASSVQPDDDTAPPAWQVRKDSAATSSVFCYHGDRLYVPQLAELANEAGFRLTCTVDVRASSGLHSQNIELGVGLRRYVICFDRNDAGDPVVHLWRGDPQTVTLEGLGEGPHEYVLTRAPGTDEAFLTVDGRPVGNPYSGIWAGSHGGRFIFGNNGSEAWGTANYHRVRLEIAPDIEEWPSWEGPPKPLSVRLHAVRKIWDSAKHNAFTDLIRWKGRFYCAFREGLGHAGDVGSVRIISSKDGVEWTSAAKLSMKAIDLRDADLSVTPDGRLMVLGGVQKNRDGTRVSGSFVSFSSDGTTFTEPKIAVDFGRWLWRVTWHEGIAYGVTYGTYDRKQWSSLVTSTDGVKYNVKVRDFLGEGEWPTEAVVQFDPDGTAYCLHRRDQKGNTTYFGSASPPYTDWKWNDLGRRLGGPNLFRLPNGHWVGGGRLYDGGARTGLVYIDVEKRTMEALLVLPSGGDTSYPGFVWHDDTLWMSYYSSHEGKTSIYLAEIEVGDRKQASARPFPVQKVHQRVNSQRSR